MKAFNKLNKFLIGITAVLAVIVIYKLATYKQWKRYYYVSTVSNPEEFPVYIIQMWFSTPNNEDYGSNFSDEDLDVISSFASEWGKGYGEGYLSDDDEPVFLPESLFIEYVDFRTQNYYKDTIRLPEEKIVAIFKEAKWSGHLRDLDFGERKMGLEFHVGIANDGNIIFWLVGKEYEKEFYRTQLKPKPFLLKEIASRNPSWDSGGIILIPQGHINNIFKDIPDSTQRRVREIKTNAQYKDSVPADFKNLQK